MRRILPVVLLAVLLVALPGAAALGQTGTEEPLVPTDTVPPTEPTATEFTPPVEPTEPDVAPPAEDLSPVPVDDGGDRPVGLITTVVIVVILAAAIGAARMIRRGPAGGDPGGATTDPYDPEV